MKKQDSKKSARIGIVGMGSMGKGLLYQSHITPGVTCAAVCDKDLPRCIEALESFSLSYRIVYGPDDLGKAVARGEIAVCEDGRLIAESPRIDVMIEASSAIDSAGERSLMALENHKPVVLMNSEIDLIFGPFLSEMAAQNGVVCTSCDGDQYGVLKHLIDHIEAWGFEMVMAGNIKGFLDIRANPTTIVPEADKRHLDYRMCTSYTDGTKLNIEMAIIANGCGLKTKKPGMFGPALDSIKDVFACFDFDRLWDDRVPFVDYVLGAEPGGGVFVIGHCADGYQRSMLSYYKMGPGPFYLFYRPYHLCHIEAMDTVVQALSGTGLLHPCHGFQTNVFAYAKVNLRAGQVLDGIGGYTCYGKIENCDDDGGAGIPICLADQVILKRPVSRDEKILMDDIDYDPDRVDFRFYGLALQASARLREKQK